MSSGLKSQLLKLSLVLTGVFGLVGKTGAAGDMPLVISEIQKSIEKSFKVKFPIQNPVPVDPRKNEGSKESNEKNKNVKEVKPVKAQEEPLKKLLKKKSPGELKIEAQLAKNRAILKKRQQQYFDSLKSNGDQNKQSPTRNNGDWLSQKKRAQDQWEYEKKAAVKRWREDKLATLKRWRAERARFKKRLPAIKADLTNIPFGSESSKRISTKKPQSLSPIEPVSVVSITPKSSTLELSFIEDTFRIPIKDQGRRPTCAAFAAVRGIEILVRSQGKERDLSEQYFYFASKPDCQQRPCQRPGSWPRNALVESQKAVSFNIPLERDCPYRDNKKVGNETQIPLAPSCQRGAAKVQAFSMVENRHEIQTRLRGGQPVIGGFKLSEDFFINTGYVFKEPGQKVGNDLHSQGHAILLIGVMELPESLHASQGRFCTLIANSWGEGWGRGGHACISDKWFDEYRYQIPFIALEKVAVK